MKRWIVPDESPLTRVLTLQISAYINVHDAEREQCVSPADEEQLADIKVAAFVRTMQSIADDTTRLAQIRARVLEAIRGEDAGAAGEFVSKERVA